MRASCGAASFAFLEEEKAMPDKGNRSVEVTVINDTQADLTVEGPTTQQSWIQGEQPKKGDLLEQYQSSVWGVFVNDPLGTADAFAQLVGLGSYPVGIHFMNQSNGQSTCQVTDNDAVSSIVTRNSGQEQNHSSFTVQLIPAVSANRRKR
jgi:hypothetical protein